MPRKQFFLVTFINLKSKEGTYFFFFFKFFFASRGIPSEVALARSSGVVMIDRRFGCSDFDRTEPPKFRVPWASKSLLSSVRELQAKWLRLERAGVPGVEFDQICLATKKKSTTS